MEAARHFDPARNNAIAGTRAVEGHGLLPLFTIEAETPADTMMREALLDRAMGPKRKRKSSEKLRRGCVPATGLALVARAADGTLAGTVRLWNVSLGQHGPKALLLGPLAVEPAMKNIGIGSALMEQAIARAAALGHAAILLVGDPDYYARFGFSAEKTGGLSMPGPFEKHRLLALELEPGTLEGAAGVLKAFRDSGGNPGVKIIRAARR